MTSWLSEAFTLERPVLELVVRAVVTYLALFGVLRVVLKREASGLGMTDLLVVVLLATTVQNAVVGDEGSVTGGLILAVTVIACNLTLNWLSFRWPKARRFIDPPALELMRDGELLRRNMRRELVTRDELEAEARLAGLGGLDDVRSAWMESDGQISVVAWAADAGGQPRRQKLRG